MRIRSTWWCWCWVTNDGWCSLLWFAKTSPRISLSQDSIAFSVFTKQNKNFWHTHTFAWNTSVLPCSPLFLENIFLGLPKYKVELKQITGDTVTPGNVQMKLWKCRKYKIQWWESRARWEEEKQMIHWETVEYSVLKSIEEDLLCQTIKGIWSNDTDFVVIERESCHLIRNTKIIFLLFFSYF